MKATESHFCMGPADIEPAEITQPNPNPNPKPSPNCYTISQMLHNILTSCIDAEIMAARRIASHSCFHLGNIRF